MKQIRPQFEVPPRMEWGLATGEYVRRGGAVLKASGTPGGGQLVAWLREVPFDQSPGQEQIRPAGRVASAFGLERAALSVLQLGATVTVGAAIAQLGARIERKLDEMHLHLAVIEKTTGQLLQNQEDDLIAELRAMMERAANDCSSGNKRDLKATWNLAQALRHKLQRRAESAVQDALTAIDNCPSEHCGDSLRKSDEIILPSLVRLRQLACATWLETKLRAEMGDAAKAVSEGDALRDCLKEQRQRLMQTLLCGTVDDTWRKNGKWLFAHLLHSKLRDALPATRVDSWLRQFGRDEVQDLASCMDFLRAQPSSDLAKVYDGRIYSGDQVRSVGLLATYVDGTTADLDRLDGLVEELKFCNSKKISMKKYRDAFQLPEEIPSGQTHVLFTNPEAFSRSARRRRHETPTRSF